MKKGLLAILLVLLALQTKIATKIYNQERIIGNVLNKKLKSFNIIILLVELLFLGKNYLCPIFEPLNYKLFRNQVCFSHVKK